MTTFDTVEEQYTVFSLFIYLLNSISNKQSVIPTLTPQINFLKGNVKKSSKGVRGLK